MDYGQYVKLGESYEINIFITPSEFFQTTSSLIYNYLLKNI